MLAALLLVRPAHAASVELSVAYSQPQVFRGLMEETAQLFMRDNPDIRIVFRPPTEGYVDMMEQTLRQAITNTLPAVSFQGLYLVASLADRRLIAPIDEQPAIHAALEGTHTAMAALGRRSDRLYGLPFSVSLPLIYFNLDLVARAGGDPAHLPEGWNDLISLGARISALGDNTAGLWVRYYPDTWYWQAMIETRGGRMISEDETRLTFDGPEGLAAARILARVGTEARMPDISYAQARQAFVAGRVGIFMGSSSELARLEQGVGTRFHMRTAPFPLDSEAPRLPSGGNAAVVHSRDAAQQEAAARYIAFMVGPVAQAIMVRNTGYMPIRMDMFEPGGTLAGYLMERPSYATLIRQLPLAGPWLSFPGPNGLRAVLAVRDSLQGVVTGRVSPEEGVRRAAEQVRQLTGLK